MTHATLKEASIFFSGAELTHSATATVQKGANEIGITGLSPVLDQRSIKIKTTNNVLVSSFSFSTNYLMEKSPDSEAIRQMTDAVAAHEQSVAVLDTNLRINYELLSVLQKSVMKNVEGSEKGLGIDDLIKTLDYFKSQSLETEAQIRTDSEKRQELEEAISKLEMQLEQESVKNNVVSGTLTLNLTAPDVSECDFTISYYTASAGWVPYYDVNVSSTQNPVKITHRARVQQTSGMDWHNVKLSLSTALPSFGKTAPLFHAWFLNYRAHEDRAKPNLAMMGRMTQNMHSYDASSKDFLDEPMEEMACAKEEISMDDFVQQTENQLNITYTIDLPYSIPGNGKAQSIELKNQEVTADFNYYSAPKLDPETFVLAEIADWEQLNLLSGNANITYEGTYVGETYIDAASTQEKLVLTLGADKRVPVKREQLKDFSSNSLLGGVTKQVFTYRFTVRNNQNNVINMVLKDQYPKSAQKDIEIELLKDTTTPTFNNEEIGVISWEGKIQPGEIKTFTLAYSIKYPKGKILGL